MEWLNKERKYREKDIELFKFHPGAQFAVHTVISEKGQFPQIQATANGTHETLEHATEESYLKWLRSDRLASKRQHPSTLILVMHTRLDSTHLGDVESSNALALPYNKETFQIANERLFQHRSLAFAVNRTSTAVFNHRQVIWEENSSEGASIVYNCKSDTASPSSSDTFDNIALSVTTFIKSGTTFAVMYGCTESAVKLVPACLKAFRDQALHPLIIPMIFAELERKRLVDMLDCEQSLLQERILDLEIKLRCESQIETSKKSEKTNPGASDCESTKLWIDVSLLKNGLESLKAQLRDMIQHSGDLATTVFSPCAKDDQTSDKFAEERKTGERIAARLHEMVIELDTKVRSCDSVLGGMALAAQMESNYYTRRDAKAACAIAKSTQKDGSRMKSIALLGMIFLPGTFLATLFSASFFNWTAASSKEVISPWIVLYFGLTITVTAITVWTMNKSMAKEEKTAEEQIRKEVYEEKDMV
ncbi:hypothetical protein LZ31DRAFT_548868 [Colletotrichum somersetense]|nr:hypothetical protein LZ31DRAFT_548868 [Colletotrichum somersetense]